MARPEKSKRICSVPVADSFFSIQKKEDPSERNIPDISLTIEEFESVRLIDYVGLTQEQCASQMHVARTTVQRMYTEARRKIAEFLVTGSSLQICGGNYKICENSDRCCKKLSCPRMTCGCSGCFPGVEGIISQDNPQ